jgi:hypothetical protein
MWLILVLPLSPSAPLLSPLDNLFSPELPGKEGDSTVEDIIMNILQIVLLKVEKAIGVVHCCLRKLC